MQLTLTDAELEALAAKLAEKLADRSHLLEPMLTAEQAARWAQVSVDTLDRWREAGLKHYGSPRCRRYRSRDLLEWMGELSSGVAPKPKGKVADLLDRHRVQAKRRA